MLVIVIAAAHTCYQWGEDPNEMQPPLDSDKLCLKMAAFALTCWTRCRLSREPPKRQLVPASAYKDLLDVDVWSTPDLINDFNLTYFWMITFEGNCYSLKYSPCFSLLLAVLSPAPWGFWSSSTWSSFTLCRSACSGVSGKASWEMCSWGSLAKR